MPYLEYLFCEHCGNYAKLDIDPGATIEAYREEGRKKIAIVQPTLIWDYLVYSCGICGNTYKYTYRDVEGRVREYFSSLSEEFKEYFDNVVAVSEQKESGLPAQPVQPQERFAERRSRIAERVRDLYTAKN
jgi:Fe-S oxidoreductase